MTDTDGKVIAAYAYSPFGAVVNKSGLAADNPFSYVGQFGVMDEGDGLFFMKQRYYDAVTGRDSFRRTPLGLTVGLICIPM